MKKTLFLACCSFLFLACTETKKDPIVTETDEIKTEAVSDVKTKSFSELFQAVSPTEIKDNVFKLVGQDYTVITAGKEESFNSMTASYGGWGQLFEKPVTWCFLRANRYTLEVMKKEQTYTMSYFDDQYKDQVIFLGSKSGRDTDKMKEITLTKVSTPSGDITYKEARLIIECKLIEITTVDSKDFYLEENKKFVEDAFKETKDYHKIVFGEITNVWIKK